MLLDGSRATAGVVARLSLALKVNNLVGSGITAAGNNVTDVSA